MQRSKFLVLLRSFSEKEIRLFEKWMNSPLHNNNSTLSLFFNLLYVHHPKFESEAVSKENIFKELFPGEPFNDARMRNLTSDLQSTAEDFLVWLNLSGKAYAQKQMLLNEMNKRKISSLFSSRLNEARNTLERSGLDRLSYSLYNFLIDREEYEHHYSQNFGKIFKAFGKFDTDKIIRSAADNFLSNLLYYLHISLDHDRIFGRKTSPKIELARIAAELYKVTGQKNILTSLNLRLVKLLITGNDEFYFEIRKEIGKKPFAELPLINKQSIVTILTNHALRQHMIGNPEFINELLELSEIALQFRFCYRDSYISHIFFFNYVYYYVSVGRITEAKKFIKRFGGDLQPELSQSTLEYCHSYISLGEGDHSGALSHLSKVTYDTPQRFVGVKNTLLKIYYEKKDEDAASFVIDSIRHKLITESFYSDYLLAAEKNFLHYFNRILKLRNSSHGSRNIRLAELRKKLNKPHFVFHRNWLNFKILELQG